MYNSLFHSYSRMNVFTKIQSNIHLPVRDKYVVLCQLGNSFSENSSSKVATLLENEDISIDQEQEQKIEKLRNKSRLSPEHHNILCNVKPFPEPLAKHHLTVKYNCRMYGIYGSESGVNPGIMWPTKDYIKARKEYEKVAYPFTIQEMVSAAKQEQEDKELAIQKRQDQVVLKLAKLELWKKELQEKLAKKEAEALAAKEKKDRLIEEVRRHFGYKVDPRDDKFKEMLVQKEKEQRKADRQVRLQEKEKKAIAKLMEKHASNESSS